MIESGTVILDLDEYNRLHLLEQKHRDLLDSISKFTENNEFIDMFFSESDVHYITISKELLKDLLDTCVDDIRLI